MTVLYSGLGMNVELCLLFFVMFLISCPGVMCISRGISIPEFWLDILWKYWEQKIGMLFQKLFHPIVVITVRKKRGFMRVHYAMACNIQIYIHVWTMTMKRKSMEKKSSLLIIVYSTSTGLEGLFNFHVQNAEILW